MVKKLQKTSSSKRAEMPLTKSVQDAAEQIWQAGLGAFNQAQAEGSKAFDALVKEGINFQHKTKSRAEEKITQAGQKITHLAADLSSQATGQWDKLETVFEDRVNKVLDKQGVPSGQTLEVLMARLDALTQQVEKLSAQRTTSKSAAKPSLKRVSKIKL